MKNEVIKLSRSMNAASTAIQTNFVPLAKGKEEFTTLMEICGLLDTCAKDIFERSERLPVIQQETEEKPR